MQKFITVLTAFLLYTTILSAQQTAIYTDDLVKYNKALSLYNSQQYLAAQTLFGEVKDETNDTTIKGDCAYYIANASVRLNQQGADNLMQNFVNEYPIFFRNKLMSVSIKSFLIELFNIFTPPNVNTSVSSVTI